MNNFTERLEKLNSILSNFGVYITNRNLLFVEISKLLNKCKIRYCFIRGAVLSIYNYERTTSDIDILIDSRDEELFNKSLSVLQLRPKFKGATKSFIYRSTPIDVIFSGEPSDYNYSYPEEITNVVKIDNNDVNFVSLRNLVEIKLNSGIYGNRLKDLGDVQELIKINNLPEDYLNDVTDSIIKNRYINICKKIQSLSKLTPLERRLLIKKQEEEKEKSND